MYFFDKEVKPLNPDIFGIPFLKTKIKNLDGSITLEETFEGLFCRETVELVETIAGLSQKVELEKLKGKNTFVGYNV